MAEKMFPADGPANFRLSWIFGPQKIHMKTELLIHIHTFLSFVLGRKKSSRVKILKIHDAILLCVRLITSDKVCVLFVWSLETQFTCL